MTHAERSACRTFPAMAVRACCFRSTACSSHLPGWLRGHESGFVPHSLWRRQPLR